jgi:hypothetical protein
MRKRPTSHLSNKWNNAVSYLELLFGETPLATASGFFWARGARMFLVTNLHNVLGRNPVTGELLSPTGGLPDRLEFSAFRTDSNLGPGGYATVVGHMLELQVRDGEKTLWFEHPELRSNVDIAVLDITNYSNEFNIVGANKLESNSFGSGPSAYASQDVFIVGFPLGLVAGPAIPVWKRGTIATDPTFDPDELPKIFIDAATREGMSGSVVLVRRQVAADDAQLTGDVIGIYSGRLHPDLVRAQLGIAWKRWVIQETVDAAYDALPKLPPIVIGPPA